MPVINDTTNLSEGLPVINDTSAKMTCVVVLSINALMTCAVDDLCGCPFNQRLMTGVVVLSINALITCVVDDLCGSLFNQRLMTCGR